MLPIRIVVRTNTPWEKMSIEDFYAQRDPMLTPMARAEVKRPSYIRNWEEAYKRSFCMYRAMCRDACMQRHKEVKADSITLGVQNLPIDGDEILLPIDDDDAYDVGIAERLREAFIGGVNLVVWPRRTNFLGKLRVEPFTRYLDTCNWAIRKSFALSFSEWPTVLAYHWIGSNIIGERFQHIEKATSLMMMAKAHMKPALGNIPLRHPSMIELDTPLSTYYMHTGSISFSQGKKMAPHSDIIQYLRTLPLHPLL